MTGVQTCALPISCLPTCLPARLPARPPAVQYRGREFVLEGSTARIYMLTQAMLLNATGRPEWLGAIDTVAWEFNGG